jgi:ketosteroid isomerase-like protein
VHPSCQTLGVTSQASTPSDPSIREWPSIDRSEEVSDTEKQVPRVLESYKSAILAKDVEAFVRLYDPNVRVFDTWGVWSYEGSSAWRVAVEGWFTSLGAESVRVAFEEVQVIAERESALVSAIVTYAGVSAQGQELRAMQNRISWALKTSGHVLRIVHEHTSAPVGFEDMKVILHREAKS